MAGWNTDRRALTTFIAACAVVAGCGDRSPPAEEPGAAPAVRRAATEGPVTLSLEVAPGATDYTHEAEITVELTADEGVTVELDDYSRAIAGGDHRFELRTELLQRETAKAIGEDKLRWTDRFRLYFFLPGEYELPAATASFITGGAHASARGAPGSSDERRSIETEPLTVTARDSSTATLSPEQLQQVTVLDPVDLPRPWAHWLWVGGGVIALIALAVWLWSQRRRRRIETAAIPIPAHEWAWRELAALIAENLPARGRMQEFYYRVSAIVRGYIERRFGVSAPEMTTEEFLETAVRDRRFGDGRAAGLRDFLIACDLVKYARREPASREAVEALRTALDFVDRTRRHATGGDASRGLQSARLDEHGGASASPQDNSIAERLA